MMLLMGMWISLTKNPIKPMIAKPIAVAIAIFWNSNKGKCDKLMKILVQKTFGFISDINHPEASDV